MLQKDNDVRNSAIKSLGQLGDSRAVVPLIKVLQDENENHVRKSAAWALGNLGRRAVEPLHQLKKKAELSGDTGLINIIISALNIIKRNNKQN